MTREEAIQYNKNLRAYMNITDKKSEYKFLEKNYIALDMAIKALEQEPVIDKIRAEIEQIEINGYIRDVECFRAGINTALNVINKYKAESEDDKCQG